jgi:predicted GNAT family acetyltransferase
MNQVTVTVADAPPEHRFEARLPDGTLVGHARYQRADTVIVFTHTEVDRAYEGGGVADQLVRTALDSVRERGLRVVAVCTSVRMFLHHHPEYAELVEPPPTHLAHLPHPRTGDEAR